MVCGGEVVCGKNKIFSKFFYLGFRTFKHTISQGGQVWVDMITSKMSKFGEEIQSAYVKIVIDRGVVVSVSTILRGFPVFATGFICLQPKNTSTPVSKNRISK